MIYAINYANERFIKAQKLNTKTAYRGGVDRVFAFSESNIDSAFYEKNVKILSAVRGNGYWLWKPYFIDKVLSEVAYGDWIVYSDSGLYYQNNLREYFCTLEQQNIDSVCQKQSYREAWYTKRDAFVIMGLDAPEYVNTSQRAAGVVAFKKNEKNMQMVKEWLYYAQDERVITDISNTCGLDNYIGFSGHRHDQSIFSLLSKKYNVTCDLIFEDFSKRKTSKAISCYHHTGHGSVFSIMVHRKIDPYWLKLVKWGGPYWKMVKGIVRKE